MGFLADLITFLFQELLEGFFAATGRWLLDRFGRRPQRIVCFFIGMVFWSMVGVLAYSVFHQ
jgi:hypothetical protein